MRLNDRNYNKNFMIKICEIYMRKYLCKLNEID